RQDRPAACRCPSRSSRSQRPPWRGLVPASWVLVGPSCAPRSWFGDCESMREGELFYRLVLAADITKRFPPFLVKALPVGCVFAGFLKLRQREIGAFLRH